MDTLVTQTAQLSIEIDNTTEAPLPRDCSDLPACSTSGIYHLQLHHGRCGTPVAAFCDQSTDGGGWTVFQRRADIQPRQDFYLGWAAYRSGFGDLEKEFWWGLEHLRTVTTALDRRYELRIELQDFDDESRYAVYKSFRVGPEYDGYRLTTRNYTGNAGDSMQYHNGYKFTTKDKDQDTDGGNCAHQRKGGWWYSSCTDANLNGPYRSGESPGRDCISWYQWRGSKYSLKAVEMKIRPT